MSNSVIDDHFNCGGKMPRTTRFYGIKFIEGKANIGDHSPLGSFSIQGTLANPKEYFREVYGPFLCTLLLTSAFTFISGAALSLAGYYVPTITVKQLLSSNITETAALNKVHEYTNTLHTLRIGGIILLGIGGASMAALILTPFICLRRSAYSPLHTAKEISPAVSPAVRSHRQIKSSRYTEPNFSCSITKQHVQPRSQTKSQRRMNQHRSSYDQGFLSPELNRGPIFVSDETSRISDRMRTRSSSCGTRLSPDSHSEHRKSSYNISDIVNNENRGRLIKTGSFHSLR